MSLTHRDARLALGQTRDGQLLLAMSRFDVMGEAAGGIPLGPTTPEMAAIMGALGATDAVMLDGGISAQLLLRGAGGGGPLRWTGLRKVPLGAHRQAASDAARPGEVDLLIRCIPSRCRGRCSPSSWWRSPASSSPGPSRASGRRAPTARRSSARCGTGWSSRGRARSFARSGR